MTTLNSMTTSNFSSEMDNDAKSVDTQASGTSSIIINASPEVQQIKGTIKEWLSIDNEIAKCNVKLTDLRKQKIELQKRKENMSDSIVNFMELNEVPFFNTPNDKIELIETKKTQGLTKGNMFNLLNKYFNNDSTKATDAVNFINENREVTIKNKLRRKKKS